MHTMMRSHGLTLSHCDHFGRYMEFQGAWFADPIFLGTYPPAMRAAAGWRLPKLGAANLGKVDFLAVNMCVWLRDCVPMRCNLLQLCHMRADM